MVSPAIGAPGSISTTIKSRFSVFISGVFSGGSAGQLVGTGATGAAGSAVLGLFVVTEGGAVSAGGAGGLHPVRYSKSTMLVM